MVHCARCVCEIADNETLKANHYIPCIGGWTVGQQQCSMHTLVKQNLTKTSKPKVQTKNVSKSCFLSELILFT